jgi:hypothetical protein
MINMNVKMKWLIWAVVVLFVINLVTLATIMFYNYRQSPEPITNTTPNTAQGNVMNGRFFRQTLGFNDRQMEEFRNTNQQFRPQTMALTFSIDSLKAAMFSEMKKQPSDTQRLNVLSMQIGNKHGLLKQRTYQFYLKIRSISNEDQQKQLEKVFEPLFINENITNGHGHQQGRNRANN